MLTVRNLRSQPTTLDWLRMNASSIAGLLLWGSVMAMLAEVGRPDYEQDYDVTSAEGAMFFNRNLRDAVCDANAAKQGRALDRTDCGGASPTHETPTGDKTNRSP